jgi:hypothetical protein
MKQISVSQIRSSVVIDEKEAGAPTNNFLTKEE